jgi:hypothetical protein
MSENPCGNLKILWGMTEYVLSGVWVKRVSTLSYKIEKSTRIALKIPWNLWLH